MFNYSKKISILVILLAIVLIGIGVYLNYGYKKTEIKNTVANEVEKETDFDVKEFQTEEVISNVVNALKEGNSTECIKYFSETDNIDIITAGNIQAYQLMLEYMEYSIVSENIEDETATTEVEVKKIDIDKLAENPKMEDVENVDDLKIILEEDKENIMIIDKIYEIDLVKQDEDWKIASAIDFMVVFVISLGDLEERTIFDARESIENAGNAISAYEKDAFNAQFEAYEGKQPGSNVRTLLSKVISNGGTYRETFEKIPSVEHIKDDESKIIDGGEVAVNDIEKYVNEVTNIRTEIENRHTYQMKLEYSKDAIVNKIIIEY